MNPIRAIKKVVSWLRAVRIDRVPAGGYRHFEAGEFTADGPKFGVEIFNDDKTPMEFVVGVLQSELDMTHDSAVAAMLHIHNKGSVLLPVENFTHAERAASAVSALARSSKHPLVCRAASAQQALAADRPKKGSG
jgi:ATP-dependent Clp protease adaptor protein ClpS